MIVLLTDFGESEYVGMMKGVLHSICPSEQVVDLTHSIRPHAVREGAWVLLNSYRYFPRRSIFVCVVDPGVGTARDAVLVTTENYFFIGPDNGSMYPAVHADGLKQVFTIKVEDPSSATFHGRDIFAKMAAYMSKGISGRYLGATKPDLDVMLKFHLDGRTGEIVREDRFGNLMTNLHAQRKEVYRLQHSELERDIIWRSNYADGPDDDVFLVTSSAGTLELCVKNGRAAELLPFGVGDKITLE